MYSFDPITREISLLNADFTCSAFQYESWVDFQGHLLVQGSRDIWETDAEGTSTLSLFRKETALDPHWQHALLFGRSGRPNGHAFERVVVSWRERLLLYRQFRTSTSLEILSQEVSLRINANCTSMPTLSILAESRGEFKL